MEDLVLRKLANKVGNIPLGYVSIAFVLFLGSSQQALAATPEVSLSDALRIAVENNPEMAAANWGVSISQGERTQAGLIQNPEISWEMEDTRSDTRTTTVQLTQPIELGGKRSARVELADRGIDAAQVEVERARNALRAEVIQAFHGVLLSQLRVDLATESMRLAERGVNIAQGRVRAGSASPVEATRATVQLSEVRLELKRASAELANAQVLLKAAMGADASAGQIFVEGDASSIPPPPMLSDLLKRLDSTPEMRLATLAIAQQDATYSLERTQRIPDVSISLGSQYSAADRERVNLVGISMPIPLFNRNQGNVYAAARRADQARDSRNASLLRMQSTIQQAVDLWRTASEEIDSFNTDILPSAKSAVDSATRGFEMGKFGFIEVLDAQRTLIGARNQYVAALSSATDSWVQIERVYGDTLALPNP
ncbi:MULTISPECIES: TolC family protein [unclassified Pseudomonas]|uniref:TolC family protein n=1 Tax=unclassified Pseudomonas TaxID=196821 RepID=UPI002449FD9B|nr:MULTISPECIES: TolC family protein [unclassified Pseudomonas]MDG9928034.1 TolC family protein [Pseudomonas sp. GD04042]MDH0482043.1 TolC family protein [Pseudomonas sp. GD04015]MDH0604062.1 TolC family protein [Pseudomonas sp. GD03869]